MTDLNEIFEKAKKKEKAEQEDAQSLLCTTCHFRPCRCFVIREKGLDAPYECEHC
jgi:hypothetical protein